MLHIPLWSLLVMISFAAISLCSVVGGVRMGKMYIKYGAWADRRTDPFTYWLLMTVMAGLMLVMLVAIGRTAMLMLTHRLTLTF